jgi:hypothetical protein
MFGEIKMSDSRPASFEILYDDLQEGIWLQNLHDRLKCAKLTPITGASNRNNQVAKVLQYDRPDAVVLHQNQPILVIERTIEVPSGHNVGQRFARLAAAAQCKTPVVYFGPYAAYKHGGETQGPRYMNLRLFYALEELERIEKSSVTIINWPVDENYEIIREPIKDSRLVAYLDEFFSMFDAGGIVRVNEEMPKSSFHAAQIEERKSFVASEVRRPEQYSQPPNSVIVDRTTEIASLAAHDAQKTLAQPESVVYSVGMRYIRSDPYTGMAMLYEYLYAGGPYSHTRNLVLHFPEITFAMWTAASDGRSRKDVRLYKQVADAILFADQLVLKSSL